MGLIANISLTQSSWTYIYGNASPVVTTPETVFYTFDNVDLDPPIVELGGVNYTPPKKVQGSSETSVPWPTWLTPVADSSQQLSFSWPIEIFIRVYRNERYERYAKFNREQGLQVWQHTSGTTASRSRNWWTLTHNNERVFPIGS